MAILVKYVEVLVSLLALLAGLSNQLEICQYSDAACSSTITSSPSCAAVPVANPAMVGSAVCINRADDPTAKDEISAEYTPLSCVGYIEETVDDTCKKVGSGYFKLVGSDCKYYTVTGCATPSGTVGTGCTNVGSDSAICDTSHKL
ncbi:hypothetical protein Zmor_011952, partial [Zophobas morio]